MDKFWKIFVVTLASMYGLGLVGSAQAATAVDDNRYAKREDSVTHVVALDDNDDNADDGNSPTSGVNSKDGTNSRHTNVSRDRDNSRGDLTKDRARDGAGGLTRDNSRHHTNDRSRNDTR